jgi:hypothetical protein
MSAKLNGPRFRYMSIDTGPAAETGARFRLDDHGAGVQWRAGILEDTSADPTYVSGTVIVGFDW